MSTLRQRRLAVSLYRNLLKWCRDTPSNLSLSHVNHQVEGISVKNSDDLRRSLQKCFRQQKPDPDLEIQQALDGLRLAYSINPDSLSEILDSTKSSVGGQSAPLPSSVPQDWLHDVEWLPNMNEMKDEPYRPSDLPLFPLSSPLIPQGDNDSRLLPLFSHVTDIPVSGTETPLKIFEPRYREMYKDVLSDGSKRFVVPVAHPYHAGRYAKYGWLYEVVRVEDIADQTQGQIHLVAHHLVTHAVRIDSIVNPADWKTQSTYLRIQGEIMEDTYAESEDLNKIAATLRELLSDRKHSDLVGRLLSGLAEGSVWSLASVWVNWLQMEALDLQVKIAADIQQQAKKAGSEVASDAMIESAQAPFRDELESLLMEVATLIPLLLQVSPREQCERMHNRIKARLHKQFT